ncbi:MAG: hypothetical protein Q4G22_04825 [Paracoccus sp. (in: a-proteobacteria)]|uniref:hypothetical protein n=1 Tax=Paracoccus sp. TaxID=267 RepID=UPI0026DF593E|nr:hypothetical protein [Paracoccus sp. (in: a-proteobacteria)]MDO5631143.1 hypothetical protein [Paracoccus sp. (in: a-proteobacteria)]
MTPDELRQMERRLRQLAAISVTSARTLQARAGDPGLAADVRAVAARADAIAADLTEATEQLATRIDGLPVPNAVTALDIRDGHYVLSLADGSTVVGPEVPAVTAPPAQPVPVTITGFTVRDGHYVLTLTDGSEIVGPPVPTAAAPVPNTPPTLAKIPDQTGTVGVALTLDLSQYAADAEGGVSFTASGLPAGLVLSGTGQLSGVPTTAGSVAATITVSDAGGLTAQRSVAWAIAPSPALLWVGQFDANSVTVTASSVQGHDTVVFRAVPQSGAAVVSAPTAVDQTYGYARATITGLSAGQSYTVQAQTPAGIPLGQPGAVGTTPTTRAAFRIGFASCHTVDRSQEIYSRIADRQLTAFYHLGDRGYPDIAVNNEALFHGNDDAQMAASGIGLLHRAQPLLYVWDDHDYGANNSGSGSPSRPAALSWYRARVPMRPVAGSGAVYTLHSPVPGVQVALLDARTDRGGGRLISADQEAWLLGVIAGLASDDALVICAQVPWIATGVADTWSDATAQRQRIADAITANAPGRVIVIAGDAHMLAFDDGKNSVGGLPVFHAAPLGRPTSVKGGPYSGGTSTASTQQYGVLEFEPVMGGWTVTYRGLSVDAAGVETQRLTHTATLIAPAPPVDVPPGVTAPPTISPNGGTAGVLLTRTAGTASGSPEPSQTIEWLLDGQVIADQSGDTLDTTGRVGQITTRDRWSNSAGTVVGTSQAVTITAQVVVPPDDPPPVSDLSAQARAYLAAILPHQPQFVLLKPEGAQMLDASGNDRHGQIVGVPGAHIAEGPHGLPFFAGTTTSHVVVPHEDVYNGGDYTVLFWYDANNQTMNPMGRYQRGDGERVVSYTSDASLLSVRVNNSASRYSAADAMPKSGWCLLAVAYAAATNTLATFVGRDGGVTSVLTASGGAGYTTTDDIIFNGRSIAGVVDRRGNSAHAGMARVPAALNKAQIQAIYEAVAVAASSDPDPGPEPTDGAEILSFDFVSQARRVASYDLSVNTAGGDVVLALTQRSSNAAPEAATLTINGAVATLIGSQRTADNQQYNSVYLARGVQSGSAAVTFSPGSGLPNRIGVAAWSVAGVDVDQAMVTSSLGFNAPVTVAAAAGDLVLALYTRNQPGDMAWSGVDRRIPWTDFGDGYGASAADAIASAGGIDSVAVTDSAGNLPVLSVVRLPGV